MHQTQSTVSVTLHRFYLNESKAVRMGSRDDSLMLLALLFGSYVVVYGSYVGMAVAWHAIKQPHQDYIIWYGHYRTIWDVLWYAPGNNTLVGVLLWAWLSGYAFISWTVWQQFEQREPTQPDDYVLLNHRDGSPVDLTVEGDGGATAADDGDEDSEADTDVDEDSSGKNVPDPLGRLHLPVVPAAMAQLPDGSVGTFYAVKAVAS